MTAIPPAPATTPDAAPPPRSRGAVFWVCRYLPAEIAGTAALVVAGIGATIWTDAPPLIALAGLIGAIVGFYGVLAATIYSQHSLDDHGRARGGTFRRVRAEFGAVEGIDTLLVRPAALLIGVWVAADPIWGLLVGKLAADVVFYAAAAGVFSRRRARTAAVIGA